MSFVSALVEQTHMRSGRKKKQEKKEEGESVSAKRYYLSDMSGPGEEPVLSSLLAGLGEPDARIVYVNNSSQALCHVQATNHAALIIDVHVLLLPDAGLDTAWNHIGSSTSREVVTTALPVRGFFIHLTGKTLFGELIRALGRQLESDFSELNFSA